MAFRFSLAAVLKYREELEKREERTLEQRREALAHLKARLEKVKESQLRLISEREALLGRGVLGDDLHHTTDQRQQIARLEEYLLSQISASMLDYKKQMKVFLAARQKWEILDELKNTQEDSYSQEQDRRDQQNVDEIFIARFSRDT
jgi:flagellar export protein FliJ